MVMAAPSPQQVGREFVRQYYTILHEAPEVLHRFYSSGSTFVHGGVDRPGQTEEPVVGQLEIDKKIKQLNFKDCHTKIRQVDSQSTIGNGVVVQVTGELSNNGEPMRRFMQTFVLAPQTPKKYYVHNDIFRYQDEVYHDISDTESTTDEVAVQQPQQQQQVEHQYENHHHVQQEQHVITDHHQQNDALLNGNLHSASSTASSSSASSIINNNNNTVNVVAAESVVVVASAASTNQVEEENRTVETEEPVAVVETVTTATTVVAAVEPQTVNTTVTAQEKEETPKQTEVPTTQTTEVKFNSWAKIVNKSDLLTTTTSQPTVVAPQQQQAQVQQQQVASTAPKQQREQRPSQKPVQNGKSAAPVQSKSSTNTSQKPTQNQSQQQQQQAPRDQSNKENRVSTNVDAEMDDFEKRFNRYPDGQQIFVGNLNQDISEQDLRNFFGQYGKVVEVRINSNTKQQSGRRLPNYGFIVFDDRQSVEVLLGSTRSNNLTYKNSKTGAEYRLNVEEKRMRQGRGNGGGGYKPSGGSRAGARSTSNGSSRNNQNVNNNNNNKKQRDTIENSVENSTTGVQQRKSNYRRP